MSAFALEDGVVYHTYSAYARGLDGLWGMYQWLDRAPLGRNESAAPTTRSTGSAATTSTTASDACGRRANDLTAAARRLRLSQVGDNNDVVRARIALLNAQVISTTRLRTVLSDAHAGSALAVLGDNPVCSIW